MAALSQYLSERFGGWEVTTLIPCSWLCSSFWLITDPRWCHTNNNNLFGKYQSIVCMPFIREYALPCFCSGNLSSESTKFSFSLSCCSVLSYWKYFPLQLALLAREIPVAFLGSDSTLQVGDTYIRTATSIVAVAVPVRASISCFELDLLLA